MNQEEANQQLDVFLAAMREQFPKSETRLGQLEFAVKTAKMVVEDLHVEKARQEADKAERIRQIEEER